MIASPVDLPELDVAVEKERVENATADLAALPWEFLHDPRRGEYLVLSSYTPLVRYFELAQSLQLDFVHLIDTQWDVEYSHECNAMVDLV